MGENGAGKTTLLKILLGELEPVKGWRKANRSLCIGYFSQHHVDQLDMSMTSIELMAQRYPGMLLISVIDDISMRYLGLMEECYKVTD